MKIPSFTRLPLFHFRKVILWQNLNQIEQYLGGAIMYEISYIKEVNCNVVRLLVSNQNSHKNTEEWCFSLIHCYTVYLLSANYQTSQSLISGQLNHRSFCSDRKLFPVEVYKPEKKLFLYFVLCQTGVVFFNQSYASFSTVIH